MMQRDIKPGIAIVPSSAVLITTITTAIKPATVIVPSLAGQITMMNMDIKLDIVARDSLVVSTIMAMTMSEQDVF